MTGADDVVAVTQLILRERQARDRGRWDRLRACYAPDATVRLSWFRGSGEEFAARSREMAGRGDVARHRLAPPVVDLDGTRAVVEVPAAIEVRTALDGIDVDLTSYARLLYRAELRARRWQIRSLDPVYERDVIVPVLPGATLAIHPNVLIGFRSSYQFLAYVLQGRGYPVANDLYGDDCPGKAAELYESLYAWLTRKGS
ncbi:nuclear transport factor 2 family protein [Amycolatopsis sp. cmx-8-4]|uniref:nuclear transport factor 2 family protein n=1 Tax=Amycolatopsis sp. cmx-8-4 TaxID=2790947 RepID=UPI00397E2B1F